MSRKAPEQINRLVGIQQYKLMQYVDANYVNSEMLDPEFAKIASTDLAFQVTVGNIQGCREALGLQSNRDKLREMRASPKTRLDGIEMRIAKLEQFMRSFNS